MYNMFVCNDIIERYKMEEFNLRLMAEDDEDEGNFYDGEGDDSDSGDEDEPDFEGDGNEEE